MSDQPVVSVIIPVYRVAAYLDECVASVTGQTYGNLEIILVDDGSDDACPAMCDRWAAKDARIRTIHQTNQGLSAARNAGLSVSHGQYVAFVDSDDIIEATMIDMLMDDMSRYRADVAVCGLRVVSDDGTTTLDVPRYETCRYTGLQALLDLLYIGRRIPDAAWGRLYRRGVLERGSVLRFPEGLTSEDYYFNAIAYYRAHTVHMNERPLYRYRIREQSICANFVGTIEDKIDIAELTGERLNAEGYEDTAALALYRTMRCYDVLFTYLMGGEYPQEVRRYARVIRGYSRAVYADVRVSLARKAKIWMIGHMPYCFRWCARSWHSARSLMGVREVPDGR
ncbi:glycosyltransferase family 2 protein [Bifidobacterium olomucense]|uniref:Glycosyl transferase family 2 n=1 Tax=Bifidobacterium olomucense TaxID=2675324 RepID=A0A7Y0EYK1_9BIFI|nr:glycosyltransferase [Bifidobacterium sp. DSM 109959]NMM97691.1 glycosyl transferase family 2 [Bifidobacterium sp. DSM 109959]